VVESGKGEAKRISAQPSMTSQAEGLLDELNIESENGTEGKARSEPALKDAREKAQTQARAAAHTHKQKHLRTNSFLCADAINASGTFHLICAIRVLTKFPLQFSPVQPTHPSYHHRISV
jgi:hypothetical protein